MKIYKHISAFALAALAMLSLASCDDYLDTLPDDRAEIDTEEKARQLMVSAYPTSATVLLNEMTSDNIGDNGRSYSSSVLVEQLYKFEDVTEEGGNDSPYSIWGGLYQAVATVNEAMVAIDKMEMTDELRAIKAEGQMIRAYCMFQLAQTFCMGWNPEKADEYLGLPYPLEPEQDINTQYTRGTLRQLYEAINKDIEEALPNISDAIYKIKKYHFNRAAAYAFAARFNLCYMNYEKAIQYANQTLGSDPTTVMRNYEPYRNLGRTDFGNRWIRSEEDCNLLLISTYSSASRQLSLGLSSRYNHNSAMASYETYWVDMPWGGGSSNNTIIYANKLYGSNECVYYPSADEQFEYTDKVAGIGYVHMVYPVCTGDQTILDRAEAYALMGNYQAAVDDINTWIVTHCLPESGPTIRPTMTIESINEFIEGIDYSPRKPDGNRDRTMRKIFHPQGFTVAEGTQENILQFILHMRRIETVAYGTRLTDIKRYGIEFTHFVAGSDPIIFIQGDLRGAIQLPQTVITAGLEANPRMSEEELKKYIEDTTPKPEEGEGEESGEE